MSDFDDPFLLALDAYDLHHNEQKSEQAIKLLDRALELVPTFDKARYLKGCIYLAMGRYEEGWPLYVTDTLRGFDEYGLPFDISKKTTWLGEKTDDLVILYDDQGFGDYIMWSRYIPMVKERCSNLRIVMKNNNLVDLIKSSFNVECVFDVSFFDWLVNRGIAELNSIDGEPTHTGVFNPYNKLCPISNLGYVFNTTVDTIPNKVPYLATNLKSDKKASVGICWFGNDDLGNPQVRCRHLPEQIAKKLFTIPNSISLQYEDLNVKNFSQTAAIINNLDLVITTDTSIAHLAGALGKPTWVLISANCCWRWLQHRNDSPWYPTMKLFRQATNENWESVIERIMARYSSSASSKIDTATAS